MREKGITHIIILERRDGLSTLLESLKRLSALAKVLLGQLKEFSLLELLALALTILALARVIDILQALVRGLQ